ncbi:hypothetical protein A9R00_03850 [Oleispira antarctica]|uniref:Uncharacterized protein n=1 Tax=Oleispira antarctica TaxID=188908 RepID=A0A1Y5HUA6_OLEAN|nr:hypothetical protein A9R00_03850 [Oleispira antarctica]
MPAPELTNTQALIDRYYTEEKAKKAQALTHASLNLQLDANDLAMLSTIAKRFGKSRDDLAKDVLSHALIDLLTQLEPGERKLIARDADEMGSSMSREIAEENGLKDVDHKPNVWTTHERSIAKVEKKRAKELEEALKAEKQARKSANLTEEAQASSEAAELEVTELETAESTAESSEAADTEAASIENTDIENADSVSADSESADIETESTFA